MMQDWQEIDHWAMGLAISEAKKAWGQTHPNPHVGAVLACGKEILASAYHSRAGCNHAERALLSQWPGNVPDDATLYVTLEPCSTTGRTPPCVDIIREKGVRRLVYGMPDPNPQHAGKGLGILREAAVEVVGPYRKKECEALNPVFIHHIQHHRALIALKIATTLDGSLAAGKGTATPITGPESALSTHHWRQAFPAIGVGAGTVIVDDPSLTIRLPDQPDACAQRFIFDRSGKHSRFLDKRKIFTDTFRGQTTVIRFGEKDPLWRKTYEEGGFRTWQVEVSPGKSPWKIFARRLLEEGIPGIILEGGPGLIQDLFIHSGPDYLFHYLAPDVITSPNALRWPPPMTVSQNLWKMIRPTHELMGRDMLIHGFLKND